MCQLGVVSESWVWPDLKNPLKTLWPGCSGLADSPGGVKLFLVLNGKFKLFLNIEFRSEFLLT